MSVTASPMNPTRRPWRGSTIAVLAGLVLGVTLVAAAVGWRASQPMAVAHRQPVTAAPSMAAGEVDMAAQLTLGADLLQLARETADPSAYGRAETAFETVLRAEPENLQALIGLGSLSLSRHEFATALDFGQRALASNPSISSSYGVIGDAQVELGMYDQAVSTIQRMVDLRPDLASYSRVSYLRELHGDLPGAIKAMRLAVAAAGPASENTEYVRVQLGNLHFAIGELDAARATFLRALERLPDYHLALAGLARVTAAQGDLAGAIDLFERAKARLPLPETVIGLGEVLEAAGQAEAATAEYALVDAMQQLNAASGVQVDLELAAFYADHGEPTVAVRLARAAYAERPTIFAADTLAWSLFQAGRTQAAARFVGESLRLGTQSSRLLYHAGVIEAALGHESAARQHLQQALELNPSFSPLDARRAQILLEDLGR